MSNQCARCGKILPSGTTRFCTECGNIVASFRPPKRSFSEGPPAWMKQLETSFAKDRPNIPHRELHVKVWKQNEIEDDPSPEHGNDSIEDVADVVDDLPTRPLEVTGSPKMNAQSNQISIDRDEKGAADELPTNPLVALVPENGPLHHISSSSALVFDNAAMQQDEIQDIPTRLHAAQPLNISPAHEKPVYTMQAPVGSLHNPVMQSPVTPVPVQHTQFSAVQSVRQTPPASIPVPTLTTSKRNNPKRLVFMCGLLFILLLAGLITWVYIIRPFSVPEITKTTVIYKNTSLGISLQYPQKWAEALNQQHTAIIFYDDNHTDQVDITAAAAANQSLNQFMSKTAGSLAMTGQKILPVLSIAGASWLQVQGNIQLSGAHYTATLLGTLHGGHYYTILQLAPASTYSLEDHLVFSKLRASFHFL